MFKIVELVFQQAVVLRLGGDMEDTDCALGWPQHHEVAKAWGEGHALVGMLLGGEIVDEEVVVGQAAIREIGN